jgi:hypothetical protein
LLSTFVYARLATTFLSKMTLWGLGLGCGFATFYTDFNLEFQDIKMCPRPSRTWNQAEARGGIVKVRGEHGGANVERASGEHLGAM